MDAKETNSSIARIVVGAMSIDGNLDQTEREKVAKSLTELGIPEMISFVGNAIDEDDGSFNLYFEVDKLSKGISKNKEKLSQLFSE